MSQTLDPVWGILLNSYPDPADAAQREAWRRDPAQWVHDRLDGARLSLICGLSYEPALTSLPPPRLWTPRGRGKTSLRSTETGQVLTSRDDGTVRHRVAGWHAGHARRMRGSTPLGPPFTTARR